MMQEHVTIPGVFVPAFPALMGTIADCLHHPIEHFLNENFEHSARETIRYVLNNHTVSL